MLKLTSLFVNKKYNKNLPLISTNECVAWGIHEMRSRGGRQSKRYTIEKERERERVALFWQSLSFSFIIVHHYFLKISTPKYSNFFFSLFISHYSLFIIIQIKKNHYKTKLFHFFYIIFYFFIPNIFTLFFFFLSTTYLRKRLS
jgi:hypothetical protein